MKERHYLTEGRSRLCVRFWQITVRVFFCDGSSDILTLARPIEISLAVRHTCVLLSVLWIVQTRLKASSETNI